MWHIWIVQIVTFVLKPVYLGRRRLQDDDVYEVEFLVDGMTENDSVTLAGLAPSDPGFQDAIKDALEEEFPGENIEILDVESATANPPVEEPSDGWKAGI